MSLSKSLPFFAAMALAAALAGCDRQSAPVAQQKEEVAAPVEAEFKGKIDRSFTGDSLPDMSFADPSGTMLSLASLKGTPVLLNLWATWCAPCKAEMPTLDALASGMAGKLRVVTVSQDLKGADEVRPWFTKQHFAHLEPWLDPDNDLGFKLGRGNSVLPTTVLYDAKGKEVFRVTGGYDWTSEQARAEIAEAL